MANFRDHNKFVFIQDSGGLYTLNPVSKVNNFSLRVSADNGYGTAEDAKILATRFLNCYNACTKISDEALEEDLVLKAIAFVRQYVRNPQNHHSSCPYYEYGPLKLCGCGKEPLLKHFREGIEKEVGS